MLYVEYYLNDMIEIELPMSMGILFNIVLLCFHSLYKWKFKIKVFVQYFVC
jgi:hypothetical protein